MRGKSLGDCIDIAQIAISCVPKSTSIFNQNRDLLTAFIGAIAGGMFTFAGVLYTTKETKKSAYGRYYLQFNISQIYVSNFIIKSEAMISLLLGVDRKYARYTISAQDFFELRENIEKTIISLNNEIEKVDFNKFDMDIHKVNQNAPLEYYKDLNFLIFVMANIYNSLLDDAKYLVHKPPKAINLGYFRSEVPLNKQLLHLKKRYKKVEKLEI